MKAVATGIPVTIVHCDAPIDVLTARVATRTGDIADADVSVLQQQSFEAFSEAEKGFVKVIDTTGVVAVSLI